jgi:hypothetical protein
LLLLRCRVLDLEATAHFLRCTTVFDNLRHMLTQEFKKLVEKRTRNEEQDRTEGRKRGRGGEL